MWLKMFLSLAAAHAYCTPSETCWPDEAAWDSLGASLEGELFTVDPASELGTCAACLFDLYCISEANHGMCMQNFNCLRGFCQEDAAWDVSERVAAVRSVADVRAAIAFANEYDVPVSIKTTGHSYTGSSTARHSLQIWMHAMDAATVTEGPYETSCGETVDAAATLEVGAGQQKGASM